MFSITQREFGPWISFDSLCI